MKTAMKTFEISFIAGMKRLVDHRVDFRQHRLAEIGTVAVQEPGIGLVQIAAQQPAAERIGARVGKAQDGIEREDLGEDAGHHRQEGADPEKDHEVLRVGEAELVLERTPARRSLDVFRLRQHRHERQDRGDPGGLEDAGHEEHPAPGCRNCAARAGSAHRASVRRSLSSANQSISLGVGASGEAGARGSGADRPDRIGWARRAPGGCRGVAPGGVPAARPAASSRRSRRGGGGPGGAGSPSRCRTRRRRRYRP